MVLSSLFLIAMALAMEALSLREWRRIGASHIPLVPPILIAIGAWRLPGAPLAAKIGLTAAGIVLHVAVVEACRRGIVPRGDRPQRPHE